MNPTISGMPTHDSRGKGLAASLKISSPYIAIIRGGKFVFPDVTSRSENPRSFRAEIYGT
jgi:hypothetical protein